MTADAGAPAPIETLTRVFGGPSDAGFGSAVFFEPACDADGLEAAAKAKYQQFVGAKWERFGADAWLGVWKLAWQRPAGAEADIVSELQSLEDFQTQMAATSMFDAHEDPEAARSALAAGFNDAQASVVRAYRIGDGDAYSGVVLAAAYASGGAGFLVFLMD